MLCVSICNSSIGFKRQFVAPMHEAYERVRKEYDQTVAARREGQKARFALRADLQTLMLPKMPLEVLERYVFEKVSIRGRALAAAVQLVGSIDGLANTIANRNELIVEFREMLPDQNWQNTWGLGRPKASSTSVIAQASPASSTKRTTASSFRAFWRKTFSNTETACEDDIFVNLE
jgi:hypothetical protein